jgi:hypothetical protein
LKRAGFNYELRIEEGWIQLPIRNYELRIEEGWKMSIKHNRSNQLVSPFRFVIPDGAPAEFRNLGIDSCMRRNDRQKDFGMATQLRIMN